MGRLSERIDKLTPLQRAVFALKETQARLEAVERARAEPIAIVGMACRFPGGADSLEAYWKLLCHGVDPIREVPRDRWDIDAYYDPDPMAPGKTNSRWGGFLERVDGFDWPFFGISEREAVRMDPQQRLALELAWEALEDAGIPTERLAGSRTGVFLGIAGSDYFLFQAGDPLLTDAFASTGTAICIAANRISFTFDLRGPSVALDTACSSSLVAIHQACQSLRSGESTVAIAGGVNVMLWPTTAVNLTKAGMSSPDGRCRAFDAGANGYVRGEGGGIIVLKPLAAALAEGDTIHALIRGSAVNQDGQSNGIKTPNRQSQEALLREVHAQARTQPGRVHYVETHGTGTLMGDMIEGRALGNVMSEDRPPGRPCLIGSVKSNIGHLETASGAAGLIKTVLALEHRTIPGNLHFQTPNPHIPFDELQLRVAVGLSPWPDSERPALAGVSALGFGGTNAHVVLEEAPAVSIAGVTESVGPVLVPVSARSPEALRDRAIALRELLAKEDDLELSDVAWTAAVRRDHHDHRLAIVARSRVEAVSLLDTFARGETHANLASGRKPYDRGPRTVFVFTSDCSWWRAAGRGLCAHLPAFRALLAELEGTVQDVLGMSLTSFVESGPDDPAWDKPSHADVAIVALQVTMASLWRTWGIQPIAVVGTGVGELAAACVARALSIKDAFRLAGATPRDSIIPQPSTVPIISAIDGHEFEGRELAAAPWADRRHAMGCTRDALHAIGRRQPDAVLVIGPSSRAEEWRAVIGEAHADCHVVASLSEPGEPREELLKSVGSLYCSGHLVAWERVWTERRRLVRLPSYPWQRQRCWLEAAAMPIGSSPLSSIESTKSSTPATSEPGEWLFEVRWEPKPVSHAEPTTRVPGSPRRRWLILGDSEGVGDRLAERLTDAGIDCVSIPPRPFDDPRSTAADALGEEPGGWEGIVHLSSLDIPDAEDLTLSDLAPAQSLASDTALALVHQLARSTESLGTRLWLVTRGVHTVGGSPPTAPAQAALWGLGRTLAQEHAHLWGGSIDLDPSDSADQFADQVRDAILYPDGEDQVAWRRGIRHVARLARRDGTPERPAELCFRADSTYLITGGLGTLARPLGRWMVERGARRLVLLGRTELPPRKAWSGVDPESRTGRKIAAVLELESLGASVHLAAVDVGDERSLTAFLEEFRAEGWPPFRGVFHLAGTAELRPLIEVGPEELARQLRPKLAGGWLLHQALLTEPLEMFVLFSSAVSVLGSPMLGAFGAASASLDALAAHRRSLGLPSLVVDWGAWQASSGLARTTIGSGDQVIRRGTKELPTDQALEVLGRLIAGGASQAIVLPYSAEDWAQQPPIPRTAPLLEGMDLPTPAAHAIQPRPQLSTPYEAPRTELERWLAARWAEILRLEQVGIHDNFFELGGDSLQGAILLNRVQAQFQEILHLLALFDTPHIAGLAAYLRRTYQADVRRLFPGELLDDTGDEAPDDRPDVIDWPDVERLQRYAASRWSRRVVDRTALGPKNRRVIFILSPPRSGSTLLRVMLAGHPRLFAPPELYLLEYDTLGERYRSNEGPGDRYRLEGAIRALMEVMGWDAAKAQAAMHEFEASGMTVPEFYRLLQDAIGDRILVDKTPGYSLARSVLEHAEEIFDDPFYIHLCRHPCGMIRSYDEYRIAEILGSRYKHPYSTRQQAEIVWVNHHQNILEFLDGVPRQRRQLIRFEDLVARPEEVLTGLCRAMGLEYDPMMAQPYAAKERRMLDGIAPESRMLGDQKLVMKHSTIDAEVADRWAEEMTTDFLGPPARAVAGLLGYEIAPAPEPAKRRAGKGAPPPLREDRIERISHADVSVEVMNHVDRLSDEEVEALLERELNVNDLGAAHE